MQSEPGCVPRSPAPPRRWLPLYRALPARMPRRWRLAISSCLLGLLTGCGQQPPQLLRQPPPPIPAGLDRPCDRGPALPEGDTAVRTLLDVWAEREAAAADCAARNETWRSAWPR